MTQQEQEQAWKDAHENGPWGFGFYNTDVVKVFQENPEANGVRVVFGLDEKGKQTAYLEPANLPSRVTREGLVSLLAPSDKGGLPCPTYCK